jgi:hypothetical protein
MTSISSLRRSLPILVVAGSLGMGLGGLGAVPAAEAGVRAFAVQPLHASEAPNRSPYSALWSVLHGIWEALGSSMDPLGNH